MCLKVVSAMLQRCNYEGEQDPERLSSACPIATFCPSHSAFLLRSAFLTRIAVETKSNGQEALALLRERHERGVDLFDLVLSDVYMPDMDGFKLLEHVGLELDLPVIMMSSNGDTNVVLRGVTHGAVDFLIKPVRIEELRNVWQHVVRRRSVHMSRGGDDSAADLDVDSRTHGTKRKESEVLRAEHEGGSANKKPRVVWSIEMHQQFVNAVNVLGIDKAVPKRILDLMNVEGLTRENVASHLQKYRLYLKRVEGVAGKGGRGNRGSPGPSMGFASMEAECREDAARSAAVAAEAARSVPVAPAPDQQQQQQMQQQAHEQQQHQQHAAAAAAAAAAAMGGHAYNPAVMGMAAHMAAWQQQTMAMQAAAAAAAASGALPTAMPPYMQPGSMPPAYGGMHHMMQPGMPAAHPHYGAPGMANPTSYSGAAPPQLPPTSSVPSFASHGSGLTSHSPHVLPPHMPPATQTPAQPRALGGMPANGGTDMDCSRSGSAIGNGHAHYNGNGNGNGNGVSSATPGLHSGHQHHQSTSFSPDEPLLPPISGGPLADDVLLPDIHSLNPLPPAKADPDQDFLDMFIKGMEGGGGDGH